MSHMTERLPETSQIDSDVESRYGRETSFP